MPVKFTRRLTWLWKPCTAYPKVTLDPKSYRFRVLNAANDRFFNLSLYQADPAAPTEVQLNPAEVAAALTDGTIFPTPVGGTEGPSWVQIGTEGGFLPSPVVVPAHPTTWVNDPTVFNAGNVDKHSLLLGPAERADVIVDFSQWAGKTLILYNDAPAAFPARDPRYDYYTDDADLRDTGGANTTPEGYGPNTRTIMQVKIAATTPAAAFNLTKLQAAFRHTAAGSGVFESSQHPIIVGQGAYNSAYNTTFPTNGLWDGFARITDFDLSFKTLSGTDMIDFPFQTKAIQDEMGEAFDPEYGGGGFPWVVGVALQELLSTASMAFSRRCRSRTRSAGSRVHSNTDFCTRCPNPSHTLATRRSLRRPLAVSVLTS